MHLKADSPFVRFVFPMLGPPQSTNMCRLFWHVLLSPVKNVLGLVLMALAATFSAIFAIVDPLFFGYLRTFKRWPSPERKGWIPRILGFDTKRVGKLPFLWKGVPPYAYWLTAGILWAIWTLADQAPIAAARLSNHADSLWLWGSAGALAFVLLLWWVQESTTTAATVIRGRLADLKDQTCTIVTIN
ncbi:MAG: hypothetical protein WDZ93_00120 [Candidatus Paceibacterota bacterium]